MFVIVGLLVLLAAGIVGVVGVLTNAGDAHPLSENFSVFGYHVTGSTGTLLLFGIVIGALAMLGLSVLLAGARRTARRGRDARRELDRSQHDAAVLNRDRGRRPEYRHVGAATGGTVNSEQAVPRRNWAPLRGHWPSGRHSTRATHANGPR